MTWRLRHDPVDAAKWRASKPVHVLAFFVVAQVVIGVFALGFAALASGSVFLACLFFDQRDQLWRWLKFTPDVVALEDVPRGPSIYYGVGPIGCAWCRKLEPKPSFRGFHDECFHQMSGMMERLGQLDRLSMDGRLFALADGAQAPDTQSFTRIGMP